MGPLLRGFHPPEIFVNFAAQQEIAASPFLGVSSLNSGRCSSAAFFLPETCPFWQSLTNTIPQQIQRHNPHKLKGFTPHDALLRHRPRRVFLSAHHRLPAAAHRVPN
ncbi:hypothetical protein FH063_000582 [Azospirillum argentinense]|uniref:Uncharacterized protein n=1 Tax=Azospirillum argentinense TaxID=2970906 RepID=A0A5B0L0J0_9PROT|nr:hypothetical protein FH063_000582 [Azospirillum argentinense]